VTETLPTTGYVTDGGAQVLKIAQPYAQNVINAFNAIGAPAPRPARPVSSGHATTTTTAPTEPHGLVNVTVLNASPVNGLAHLAAAAIAYQGFHISEIGDATTPLTSGTSEILYGPSGKEAALTLASVLTGPVTTVADSNLHGQDVSLLVASDSLRVTPAAGGSASTTTVPTVPTPTTTTTIPSDVYTNSQVEPWNPSPCTLGASTQASPKTATTTPKKKR
jgi:hypothetical protein